MESEPYKLPFVSTSAHTVPVFSREDEALFLI